MCELFAMSSRLPATVTLSLMELARRGGLTGPHADGVGLAYYDDGDLRLIRDEAPAHDSPWVRLAADLGLRSDLVICHIRKATRGTVALRNTHPFHRELGGRMHVFAHNGSLAGIEADPRFVPGCYRPIGETDSERAFCVLMERLRAPWLANGRVPRLADRLDVVSRFAAEIGAMGPANFLYADGDTLFVHANRRIQDDGEVRAPGLYVLCRACTEPVLEGRMARAGVRVRPARQDVALVASVPLSEEEWRPLGEGEVLAIGRGRVETRRAAAG